MMTPPPLQVELDGARILVPVGFDASMLASGSKDFGAEGRKGSWAMIPRGVEVFLGLESIDLRWSFDRLAGIVGERIGREARTSSAWVSSMTAVVNSRPPAAFCRTFL
jgi:hypothetical protein